MGGGRGQRVRWCGWREGSEGEGGRGQRMRWCGWREGSEDEVVWVEGGVRG